MTSFAEAEVDRRTCVPDIEGERPHCQGARARFCTSWLTIVKAERQVVFNLPSPRALMDSSEG